MIIGIKGRVWFRGFIFPMLILWTCWSNGAPLPSYVEKYVDLEQMATNNSFILEGSVWTGTDHVLEYSKVNIWNRWCGSYTDFRGDVARVSPLIITWTVRLFFISLSIFWVVLQFISTVVFTVESGGWLATFLGRRIYWWVFIIYAERLSYAEDAKGFIFIVEKRLHLQLNPPLRMFCMIILQP